MTITYKDSKNRIDNYIQSNSLINILFSNIFFVSIIILLCIIIIFEVNKNNSISSFLYSLLGILIILIINTKILKNKYKTSPEGDLSFEEMMKKNYEQQNIKIIASNELHNKSDILHNTSDDIKEFLNT